MSAVLHTFPFRTLKASHQSAFLTFTEVGPQGEQKLKKIINTWFKTSVRKKSAPTRVAWSASQGTSLRMASLCVWITTLSKKKKQQQQNGNVLISPTYVVPGMVDSASSPSRRTKYPSPRAPHTKRVRVSKNEKSCHDTVQIPRHVL